MCLRLIGYALSLKQQTLVNTHSVASKGNICFECVLPVITQRTEQMPACALWTADGQHCAHQLPSLWRKDEHLPATRSYDPQPALSQCEGTAWAKTCVYSAPLPGALAVKEPPATFHKIWSHSHSSVQLFLCPVLWAHEKSRAQVQTFPSLPHTSWFSPHCWDDLLVGCVERRRWAMIHQRAAMAERTSGWFASTITKMACYWFMR